MAASTLDPHISGKTERPSAVQHTIDMYNMNGEILLKLKSDTYKEKETIIIDRNQYLISVQRSCFPRK